MVKECMFELIAPLPKEVAVAVSGGMDSMAALHWLNTGKKVHRVIHINHKTPFSNKAENLVCDYCLDNGIPISIYQLHESPPVGVSSEKFWRDFRYEVFLEQDLPVVTAHTLDDCVEELVFSTFVRGYVSVIPYRHSNVIRPFRLWSRRSIESYVKRNNIPYVEDPSNKDLKYKRNYIRHEIVPRLIKLNPGLYKTVSTYVKQGGVT